MKKTKGRNGGTLYSTEKGDRLNPKGKPVNSITEYIKAGLKADREIIIEGIDVETGQVRKFRVKNPTAEVIGSQILRQAAKGAAKQQEMVLDRTEGKVMQGVGLSNIDGTQLTMPAITFQIEKPSEVERSKPK